MANPEHLTIFNQGVEEWNTWRKKDTSIQPDLEKANLTWIDLRAANLNAANLYSVYLAGANLTGVDLHRTNLQSADLGGVNLHKANMAETNLRGANITGANLTQADLSNAQLNLAHLGDTLLTDVDLSTTIGLDSCDFLGPCSLDHRTLKRSGPLPLSFLRGCGLQDWEIETAKLYDLTLSNDQFIDIQHRIYDLRQGSPIQYQSLFISFASANETIAKKLHVDLQKNGVRCWFAPEDLKIGQKIRSGINVAIQNHERVLVILSKQSVASTWVQAEVETALEKESIEKREVLFPIRVDEEMMQSTEPLLAHIRRTTHIGDFTKWQSDDDYKTAFQRLLKDLREGRQKG